MLFKLSSVVNFHFNWYQSYANHMSAAGSWTHPPLRISTAAVATYTSPLNLQLRLNQNISVVNRAAELGLWEYGGWMRLRRISPYLSSCSCGSLRRVRQAVWSDDSVDGWILILTTAGWADIKERLVLSEAVHLALCILCIYVSVFWLDKSADPHYWNGTPPPREMIVEYYNSTIISFTGFLQLDLSIPLYMHVLMTQQAHVTHQNMPKVCLVKHGCRINKTGVTSMIFVLMKE